ncbi:efflux RND transporter periplasmic adaptor subunit [Marinimicrobium sp. C6131]|uniref:efflux RND transporter periplasmic adaptor subunit n=1 Tax=Marinimicrobium sp. C6131 TaxID=3022676 RepID=UPI00223E3581|nr:efflux RND transporter periplasmic adaptor subunit [Marinimicrobium sp. C6131]UZJ44430.1 efflux RND transporter periplasmic adaptor subunit [Marinimicrobium sp. C6131]
MSDKSELLSQLRIDRDDGADSHPTKWPWVIAGAILLAMLAGTLWAIARPDPVKVETRMARVAPQGNAVSSVLDATGYVTARRYATVSSKVTAKVLEVLVEEGMRVEEGQVVARLDDSNARKGLAVEQANLTLAEAQLEETRARLTEARLAQQRVEELFRRELVSESELDRANSNYQSLKAQLAAREAGVLSAQRLVELQEQNLEDLTLRAPFTGVVVSKDAQPGEMISPVSAGGGFTRTGICSLVDMHSLEIEVDVNESYIQRVTAGQPVQATLEAYPDWNIPARVIAVVPTADRQKATVRVRVGFEQTDARILPDMGVRVAFLESESREPSDVPERTILVPSSAVIEQGGESVLFVVREGVAYRRVVSTRSRPGGEVVVRSGLEPGEQYVVGPPEGLADGVAVKTQ